MPGMHLFEYAVIRVVPRVEREEFLNVGVILYCRNLRFLQARYTLDEARLCAAFPGINLPELRQYLDAFCSIAAGAQPASPIAGLDVASRFRWLTATRSTVLQTSKVHPGHCGDPEQQVEHLMQSFVWPETPGKG